MKQKTHLYFIFWIIGLLLFSCSPSTQPKLEHYSELIFLVGEKRQRDTQEKLLFQEKNTESPNIRDAGEPKFERSPDIEKNFDILSHTDDFPPPEHPKESLTEPFFEPTIDLNNIKEDIIDEPIQEISPSYSSWIGEKCRNNSDCPFKGGYCLKENSGYKGGHCSQSCTNTCPDQAGKPITFCIANNHAKGYCVSQCEHVNCRVGYNCELRQRINQPSKMKKVCVPVRKPPPNGQRTILYIGDSQSSGSKLASHLVSFLREPRHYCASAKTGGNKVYSYAKVSAAARHWGDKTGSSKSWLCQATKVYVNGTASSNTTGAKLCAGITNQSRSIFQRLIALHQPDTFIIQLGANSMGFSETYVKRKIKAMLDQIPSNSLCFWVAPCYGSQKYLAKKRAIEKWLKETFLNYSRLQCHIITSINEMSKQTTCHPFNAGDGLHMTYCGSLLWGQLVSRKICLSHKL